MRPAAKIAVGGVLGGLMLTIALVAELRRPTPPANLSTEASPDAEDSARIPARCKSITMPDSGCDAAWEASRRHFFGDQKR